jgi:hypothetical protein
MSLGRLIVLAGCILVPLFILLMMIVCIASRVRRRWLWIIFILLGCFVQFEVNWSSGQWSVKPLNLVLLGAGFYRFGVYGPWILHFALPVGAIVFLICLPSLLRKDRSPGSSQEGSTESFG